MECTHENMTIKTIKKEFEGHIFKTKGQVCVDCGSELWDNKISFEFHTWLQNLKFENTKQYLVSENTSLLLNELMQQIYCKDESKFIRAMIIVMNANLDNPECNEMFRQIMETEDYKRLESEKSSVKKKVRITNAKTMYDFTVWSKLMGLTTSEMIRTELMLTLVMCKNTHEKFAEFWNMHFKKSIELILAS